MPSSTHDAGRRALNTKLRNLIQQLGEAIHETVADSEDIAGVVRNIRAEGFDVLLMLEATIGLNEVDPPETGPDGAGDATSSQDKGPFTAQDLHFLRSLRIRTDAAPEEGHLDGEWGQ
jgi:hypothetical protein